MTDRKKPGWAFWTTMVVVVVLVGYTLSFGPACWWFSKPLLSRIAPNLIVGSGPDPMSPSRIYWPIGWVAKHGPSPVSDAIFRYAKFFQKNDIKLPAGPSGGADEWYGEFDHFFEAVDKQMEAIIRSSGASR